MLTTLNILSRDQGKLFATPATEDKFYARFTTADAPAKAARVWTIRGFLRAQRRFFLAAAK